MICNYILFGARFSLFSTRTTNKTVPFIHSTSNRWDDYEFLMDCQCKFLGFAWKRFNNMLPFGLLWLFETEICTKHKDWNDTAGNFFLRRKKPHICCDTFSFFYTLLWAIWMNQVDLQTERDFEYFVPFRVAAVLYIIKLLVWLIALSTGSYCLSMNLY